MGLDWRERSRLMVERQLRGRGIHDQRVLDAMLDLPRQEFVPEDLRHAAYADEPLAIGWGQTISQPYMTALMAQCLELAGPERVLEVGGGCGYAAAVLGALAADVVSVELIPELAAVAVANLERTGRSGNITVLCRDGSRGVPELAPFDAISVPAAAAEVPEALLEQLAEGGRLVIPIGAWEQELRVLTRREGRISSRTSVLCSFVPLRSPADAPR